MAPDIADDERILFALIEQLRRLRGISMGLEERA